MFDRIAIVAAMESEIGFLRKAVASSDRTGSRCVVGDLGSKTVVLLRAGVGPQKTTRRLTETKAVHDVQCVLSIGCAGALSPDIGVGSIVISEKIIDDTKNGQTYHPSPELITKARDNCETLKIPFHLGATVSTSNVAASPEEKADLAAKYGVVAVDMETAKVAEWAHGRGIPMLSIRAISDGSADSIPPEIGTIFDPNGKLRPAKALSLFATKPGLMLELLRLKKKFDSSIGTLEKIVMPLLHTI